jgi:hypothetical protein
VELETEKRITLSILNAWKYDGTKDEVPWHITDLGWHAYANHPDEEIRSAAIQNPYYGCPSRVLQERRREYKLNVKEFT